MTDPNQPLPERLPQPPNRFDEEVREILYQAVLDESGDCFSVSEAPANAVALVDRIERVLTSFGYRVVQAGNPFARVLP